MTLGSLAAVDWQAWLRRWDRQQAGYLPDREERFGAMLDVLGETVAEPFVALDLACGPGAVSQRLLARFPRARCVALDWDPVLLALGQGALGTLGGRLRWVEADLRASDWVARVGEVRVDAVLSTTALHWLDADQLRRTYRELGRLVRPGGVVMNGDTMRFGPAAPTLQAVADRLKARRRAEAFARPGAEDWDRWWAAIAAEPALRDLVAERARRFPTKPDHENPPDFDVHEAALRAAGFREVGVVWQRLANRVLVALR